MLHFLGNIHQLPNFKRENKKHFTITYQKGSFYAPPDLNKEEKTFIIRYDHIHIFTLQFMQITFDRNVF